MGKYLGIDYGTKRVGLATGDTGSKVAHPLTTVSPDDLPATLRREGPFEAVVLGLPRGLDGQETTQTLSVRHFADQVLWGQLRIEAVFQDEAATSAVAEEQLKESGRKYTKADIDAAAAAIILQDYLDAL